MTGRFEGTGGGPLRADQRAQVLWLGETARELTDEDRPLSEAELRVIAYQADASLSIREREHDLEISRRTQEHDLRMNRRYDEHELQCQMHLDTLRLEQIWLDQERERDLHRIAKARGWTSIAGRILVLAAAALYLVWCARNGFDPKDATRVVEDWLT